MLNRLFQNRQFLRLWLSEMLAGLGDALFRASVMVVIYNRTGSAVQTAGVMVATTLPSFLFSPFAGVVVDKFSRRVVLLMATLLRALTVGLMLLFITPDSIQVWGIYLVTGLLATIGTFRIPARQALIPMLVPRERLVTVNGLMMCVLPVTMAIGFLVGGYLVPRTTILVIITLVVICLLLSVGVLVGLRGGDLGKDDGRNSAEKPALLQSIRYGFIYTRQHPIARPLTTMEIIEHVPHGIWTAALMMVFVEKALDGGAEEWGMQNAAFFGAMLFGMILATLNEKTVSRYPGWMIIGNAFLNAIMTIIYAYSPTNAFAVVLAFAFGVPFALRDIAQDGLLQTSVDETVLGRVYAFREMGRNVTFLFGGLFFAWLANYISIRTIYVMGGLMYFGTTLYAISSRALRESQINGES